ncbi:hypothetical protein OH77DRAFT_534983 [Trametes cingulata]|nr:hypothetical protein OH77DRAFT_534983 [Trametes cingulata]
MHVLQLVLFCLAAAQALTLPLLDWSEGYTMAEPPVPSADLLVRGDFLPSIVELETNPRSPEAQPGTIDSLAVQVSSSTPTTLLIRDQRKQIFPEHDIAAATDTHEAPSGPGAGGNSSSPDPCQASAYSMKQDLAVHRFIVTTMVLESCTFLFLVGLAVCFFLSRNHFRRQHRTHRASDEVR